MHKRYEDIVNCYRDVFGTAPAALFSAPGRSEILGNHTDHQLGEVLAAAIDRDSYAAAAPSGDSVIRLYANGYGMFEIDTADLTVHEDEKGTTAALIRGVAAGFAEHGYKIGGFTAATGSEVLSGSGLSSSASYESLLGIIFSELFNEGKTPKPEIAVIGQFAENKYFGKPCGLMDQMACSVGSLCHMDFADPKNPVVTPIAVNPCDYGYTLCITDTKGSHADLTDEYAAVTIEMKAAAAVLGKEVLWGTTMEELLANANAIREKCGDRAFLRALHYVEEIERVHAAKDALLKEDIPAFLACVRASGNSSYRYVQNVFTTKDAEHQAMSVGLAVSEYVLGDNGVCRVHGGGFAGTIQAYVKNDYAETYRKAMDALFGEGACMEMKIRPEGVMKIDL